MTSKRLAIALAAALFGTATLATTVPTAENKSSTAKPVPSPRAHSKPPAAPDVPAAPDTPDTSDLPDVPGISRGNDSEKVGIGQDVRIGAGETHDGDVVCVGGHVRIDGHVNGDVTVVAGTLDITGSVDGDVTAVATRTDLDPAARINGSLSNVGGSLHRNAASVNGQVVNIPFGLSFPGWRGGWTHGFGGLPGVFIWWRLFGLFLFFVCALLLTALVPDRIRLISEDAPARLFTALIFGLVGYVVLVFVQMFLAVTIIGLPLVFLIYLVFVVLKWMAMCGIFHQIGSRLGRAMGREMSLFGGILLGFLPFALLRLVPFCIGFSIWFLVEILAFGYLILTRVGTRGAPGRVVTPPPPPVLPSEPIPGSV